MTAVSGSLISRVFPRRNTPVRSSISTQRSFRRIAGCGRRSFAALASARVTHRARDTEDDRVQARNVQLELGALSLFDLASLVDHGADPVSADLDVSHRITTRMRQLPRDDLLAEIVVLRGHALEGELPTVVLIPP